MDGPYLHPMDFTPEMCQLSIRIPLMTDDGLGLFAGLHLLLPICQQVSGLARLPLLLVYVQSQLLYLYKRIQELEKDIFSIIANYLLK